MLKIKEGDAVTGAYTDRQGHTVLLSGIVALVFDWGVQTRMTPTPDGQGFRWSYNLAWSEITHINDQPI